MPRRLHPLRGGRQAGFNDVNDIFGAFGDLFEGFFGGQTGRGGGRRPSRGNSLRCSIEIDLREAAFGCTRTVEVERAEFCSTCDGSGARPGSSARSAATAPTRQIVQAQDLSRADDLPRLPGAGEVIRDKCAQCSATGRQHKLVRLEVKVPPGVDNGMQLAFVAKGNRETAGDRAETCTATFRSPNTHSSSGTVMILSARFP